ncbi:translation initiation factor IF-3 [Peptoclostridium acidaminophilum DSM 3953]|uniref:Translation initiation factor IF-3 n=1 Tax=Peptoclostridium acidaminophilum DSM 3953 TaxID=1286171 RepID=W8T359_PEPAC|nr:translation initiation factor IF-3 [Peptoclostridium acidaminophilum DSM 3953]
MFIIKDLQINEQIRDKEVRLISDTGEQLGIVATKEAQRIANEKNLDLVKVSPGAKPPVCKLIDYGKYKYELAKKEKESKKHQKIITIKEIRLRPRIEGHDLETKAKMAAKFLEKGDKVKVVVRFRGRELGHREHGLEIVEKFAEMLSDFGVYESKPKFEGNNLVAVLEPKNQ